MYRYTSLFYSLIFSVFLYPSTVNSLETDPALPRVIKLIANNDLTSINAWLDDEYVPGQTYFGTPLVLFTVTERCNIGALKAFVNHGADINAVDEFMSASLIHWAAPNKDVSCLKYLIDNGAKVDVLNENAESPYFEAIWSENEEAINILANAGLSLFMKNNAGVDVIHISVIAGRSHLLKTALRNEFKSKTEEMIKEKNREVFEK